jgi:hypothetical protein
MTQISIDDCAEVEVTFAAILAAHECDDFEAIKAAENGGSAWEDYLADYIGRFSCNDFMPAPFNQLQSAELRLQVVGQSAGLPHKLFWVDAETGQSSVPMGEFANKTEAEAAASASDIELLQRCANDEACRVEVQTGFWQVKCDALNQHGTR